MKEVLLGGDHADDTVVQESLKQPSKNHCINDICDLDERLSIMATKYEGIVTTSTSPHLELVKAEHSGFLR